MYLNLTLNILYNCLAKGQQIMTPPWRELNVLQVKTTILHNEAHFLKTVTGFTAASFRVRTLGLFSPALSQMHTCSPTLPFYGLNIKSNVSVQLASRVYDRCISWWRGDVQRHVLSVQAYMPELGNWNFCNLEPIREADLGAVWETDTDSSPCRAVSIKQCKKEYIKGFPSTGITWKVDYMKSKKCT